MTNSPAPPSAVFNSTLVQSRVVLVEEDRKLIVNETKIFSLDAERKRNAQNSRRVRKRNFNGNNDHSDGTETGTNDLRRKLKRPILVSNVNTLTATNRALYLRL